MRLLIWILGALLVTMPVPGRARHGAVDITIHSDGAGALWVDVTWSDGHPVDETVTALVVATSAAGTRVGPVGLRPAPGHAGTVTYAGTLDNGRWRVAVDVASPGLGHCEGDVPVDRAAPAPADAVCDAPPDPVASPGPEASRDTGGGSRTAVVAVLSVIAALAVGAFLAIRRWWGPAGAPRGRGPQRRRT